MARYPSWGFGDVSDPATAAGPADPQTAAAATGVALNTATTFLPDASNQTIDQATHSLKQRMVEAAAETAAVQLGVSISIDVFLYGTIVGAALGALLTIIQSVASEWAKRKVKEYVSSAVGQIQSTSAAMTADLQARAQALVDQEWPNAQVIAASNVTLNGLHGINGLGDNWFAHDVAQVMTSAGKFIAQTAAKLGMAPTAKILQLIGDNHDAKLVAKKQQQWDNYVARWGQHLTYLMSDPKQFWIDIHEKPVKYIIGTEDVDVVKGKCADLVAKATAQLQQFHDQCVAVMATPAYLAQLRVNLAKLIRGDPTMLSMAQQQAKIIVEADQTAQLVAQAGADGQTVAQASAKTGSGIFGGAALIALVGLLA